MGSTYTEFTAEIEPLEVGRDILIAELSEIGFESFVETESGLQAYIQTDSFNQQNIESLTILKNPNFSISHVLKEIEDQNWNKKWEESFDPINVDGKCLVRAPFHNPIEGIEHDIIIDPKMSFGTGHHATTYLMLSELYDMEIIGKDVLDMGCGTGVLAILAKQLGASNVVAIDIDEWAYENTMENIRNNNCDEIKVFKGGAEQIRGDFDVVLANINRNILIRDMESYVSGLNKGGDLLLSGFFESDVDLLINAAVKLGLTLEVKKVKNEWCMLHMKF